MDRLINRRHNRQHQRSKKKVTPKILALFGVALGCIGLSYDDFCKMDYDEFASVYAAYADQRDAAVKDEWSRMRLHATICIQPHLAMGKRVTPEKLLPFHGTTSPKTRIIKRSSPSSNAESERRN